jgi:Ser/Thr protein kinase RdoA (MazF antagonist)
VLEHALTLIGERLQRFGSAPERFGLIHADLRLANLLVDDTHLRIIDFDDCGFSWFLYDFATAVSFIEDEPIVPALLQAWLAGYARVAPLSARGARRDSDLRGAATYCAVRMAGLAQRGVICAAVRRCSHPGHRSSGTATAGWPFLVDA